MSDPSLFPIEGTTPAGGDPEPFLGVNPEAALPGALDILFRGAQGQEQARFLSRNAAPLIQPSRSVIDRVDSAAEMFALRRDLAQGRSPSSGSYSGLDSGLYRDLARVAIQTPDLLPEALGKITEPDEGGGFFDAIPLAGGLLKGIVSGTGEVFKAADYGRAAVASTIKETADFVQGEGFSTDDWKEQFQSRAFFGELFDLDVNFSDWIGAPEWLDTVLNTGIDFTADVAMDPLTYLIPGSGLADDILGSTTRLSERLILEGHDDLARKLFQKGG